LPPACLELEALARAADVLLDCDFRIDAIDQART
jgi:hypothetical protein